MIYYIYGVSREVCGEVNVSATFILQKNEAILRAVYNVTHTK